jgi:hypothetical protein
MNNEIIVWRIKQLYLSVEESFDICLEQLGETTTA